MLMMLGFCGITLSNQGVILLYQTPTYLFIYIFIHWLCSNIVIVWQEVKLLLVLGVLSLANHTKLHWWELIYSKQYICIYIFNSITPQNPNFEYILLKFYCCKMIPVLTFTRLVCNQWAMNQWARNPIQRLQLPIIYPAGKVGTCY